jgi:hypothetical protein
MRSIEKKIVIDAPAEKVWQALTDFPAHGSWDPMLESIAGEKRVGAEIEVKFRNGMSFRPKITELKESTVFEWLGKLGLPFIFSGRHRFQLEPAEPGKTRLAHSEKFTGILVPFMGKVFTDTEKSFADFNEALKTHVERDG